MTSPIPQGMLLAVEGPDGSGKSTAARALAAELRARGFDVVLTREPGGSPLAEAIRGVALGEWGEGVTVETEALLMYAARAAHLNSTILPALARGSVVLIDRFQASSRAYQCDARGMPLSKLEALNDIVLGSLRPDLTLVLDCPVDTAMQRVANRSGASNRFDIESKAFHQRVRQSFLTQAAESPDSFVVIDASRSEKAVLADVLDQTLLMAQAINLATTLSSSPSAVSV